jgi:hypothetical protein
MRDNDRVLKFIRRVFPKYETDPRQMESARAWTNIIFKFFRDGLSARKIAEELGCPTSAVERVIQRIRLAVAHRRQDGKPRTGRRKGRPMKPRPKPQPKPKKTARPKRRPNPFQPIAIRNDEF